MDCCTVEPTDAQCPACGVRGRKVRVVTLRSLVPEREFRDGDWRFCRTLNCLVAYFHDSEPLVEVKDVSVVITHKTTDPRRLVCYCFGFTAADIAADPDGLITEDIKGRCRRGEDRCPETNPQGSCCLGNVLALRRAEAEVA